METHDVELQFNPAQSPARNGNDHEGGESELLLGADGIRMRSRTTSAEGVKINMVKTSGNLKVITVATAKSGYYYSLEESLNKLGEFRSP